MKADEAPCRLEVFDLDRTIVTRNCSFDFCYYLAIKRVLPKSSLLHSVLFFLRHRFLGMTLLQLHRSVFEKLLKGVFFEKIEENVNPFLQDYLFSRIYPPVLAKLHLAQHLGHRTMILSNSPSFLVKRIAELLGVDEWRATEYSIDKQRRLCDIASIMQGKEKAACVEEVAAKLSIEKGNITAYSDSILDLPLLLCAGKAVAVNPDRKLRSLSLKNDWTIL